MIKKYFKFYFQGLTNWGRENIVSDLTPDDDSIEIIAFFSVCDTATDGTKIVNHELKAGTAEPHTGTYNIDVNATAFEVTLPSSTAQQ